MQFTNPEGQKLYQRVADTVAARIQAGAYKTGQRLPSERDLADEFGVSRPTVREAMIALEIRGWVEARAGSGAYVVDRSASSASAKEDKELDIGAFELTEARLLFEGETCALAASTISDAELEELESILQEMAAENEAPSFSGEHADRRFHVAIAKATRNTAIASVVANLWDIRYRSPLCAEMLQRARDVGLRPLIDDHRDIVIALKARDSKAARDAMRAHLGRVIEDLLAATELEEVNRARLEAKARREEMARRSSV